jgi:NTE family protein
MEGDSPVALDRVPTLSPAPKVAKVFSPVGIQGVEYEDGDESLPVAVRAARQAGATFVIAVDVTAQPGSAPPNTSLSRLEREAR